MRIWLGANWKSLLIVLLIGFVGILFISGGRAIPAKAISGTLTWQGSYASATGQAPFFSGGNPPGWAPQQVSEDIVVTNVAISVTGMPWGASGDVCINLFRYANPSYPAITAGYSEVLCGHADLNAASGNPSWNINLAQTPLYMPRDTGINCYGNLSGVTQTQAEETQFRCDLSYQSYTPGGPRYRLFRLPYNDQVVDWYEGGGHLSVSYYKADPAFPLHVKGFNVFQAFGSNNWGSATPCLRQVTQNLAFVRQSCMNTISISPTTNYVSPPFFPLDWTITGTDMLTATCENSVNTPDSDCALFVLTEIPSVIVPSTENIVRDYKNVPHPFLEIWCAENVSHLGNSQYCSGQPTCSDQVKIANCIALYPAASCLATNTCLATNNAQFISQNVPTTMTAGQQYPVSIVMKNTGTNTWSTTGNNAGNYRIGSQNPQDNSNWGATRFPLSSVPVVPGQTTTVNFTVTAPSTPGTYNFQWRMNQATIEWFGDVSQNVAVNIVGATPTPTPPPGSQTITWSGGYTYDHPNSPLYSIPWISRVISSVEDVVITRITYDVTNIPVGTILEDCLFKWRTVAPTYPAMIGGYSDAPLCTEAYRKYSAEDWHVVHDLTNTPLFIPKDTTIAIGSNLHNAPSAQAAANTHVTYTITYQTYTGGPRFRTLRFPYADQSTHNTTTGENIPTTHYKSSQTFPLTVKGLDVFISTWNDEGQMTPCLRHLRPDGTEVRRICFPLQSTIGTNHTDPPILPLNWTLPVGDVLSATCPGFAPNGVDCALWALVEIPQSLAFNLENTFRDYGNVPAQTLLNYCTQNVHLLSFLPYYCNGQSTCSDQVKIANCIALYPVASCLAANTCLAVNNAQFISQNVPTTMTAGQQYPVSVTFKNTGTTTWSTTGGSAGNYRIGSQNPQDNNTWGATRFPLPVVDLPVLPGQTTMVNFTVNAPSTPGTYNFQWRMNQATVEWFGDTTQNVAIHVNAPPDTTPPSVSIIAPANGSDVSGIVTVTANATDNVGVSRVEFYVDGAVVEPSSDTASYSFSWDTRTVKNGDHALTARAYDTSGNTGISKEVVVTVTNATKAKSKDKFFFGGHRTVLSLALSYEALLRPS